MAFYKEQRVDWSAQRACEFLGGAGRLLALDLAMSRLLVRSAVKDGQQGVGSTLPVEMFHYGKQGHCMFLGLDRYRLGIDGQVVRVVNLCNHVAPLLGVDHCNHLWVVEAAHYKRLYRFLRRQVRSQKVEGFAPPIMRETDMKRLLENTTEFLLHGRELLERYNVPQKRGLLLLGEPGNGKTMACRWLYDLCCQAGLEWENVTTEEYKQAAMHGTVPVLFSISGPGIILFDDFEIGIRHRDQTGPTADHSTILSELDGVNQRQGVVYIFTTNASAKDLDPAFLRRGRIDQVIQFPKPDADLRRRLVERFWHDDIRQALDVQRVVADSEGLSFAEVEELKKLLVVHYIDTQTWDWGWAQNAFRLSGTDNTPKKIGFGTLNGRNRLGNGSIEHLLE